MLEAERIEPGALAAQIGTVQGAALPNLPIVVTPRDPRVAEARVVASPESQEVSDIILIPSGRLTLAELAAMFGSYEESPRLHPDRPRKLVFSPGRDSEHTFVVRIIAEVQAVGAQIGAADVERVLLTRARAAERTATPASAATSVGTTVWPRLLGQRASFGVRSWRAAALERVREEVERSLGVRFTASADK